MAGRASEKNWQARAAFQNPPLVLAVLAALNTAVYFLVFVQPRSLAAHLPRPLLDLRQLSAGDPLAQWRLLAGFGLLGLLYWLGWRAALRTRSRAAWLVVLAGAATSSAVLILLYPFDAADVFDNIMHGRILGVYGANPFDQIAADFKADPFYLYVGWPRTPSAYGPAWELLAAATARLSGDGIAANVLAFKALGGLFLTGCVAIVADLLRRSAPERALAGVLLLAWNPLILYETLGHGHNDVAMLFWVMACAWCLARTRYTLAVLALVVGALFKFVPLLLFPAAGLISLRALPDTKARLRFAVVTISTAGLLIVLAYAPFWHGPGALGLERRVGLFTSSLPAATFALLEPPLGKEGAAGIVSAVAAVATALFALWQGVRASREPSWQSFVQAAFTVLMFYLLLTCLWFQQWYVVWPLGLVPLLSTGPLAWLGVVFGFAVLSKPLIFEPLWLWPNPYPNRSWLELRLGPAVLAFPWLITLVVIWMGWRVRAPRHRLISKPDHDA